MDGFRFSLAPYGNHAAVLVWSRVNPPHRTSNMVLLPVWIADKFRANPRLHTVVTDLDERFIEENELVA